MNEIWRALAREGALAAEHLAMGITSLGKANYSQHGYYNQAFFGLTIGLERTAKLIIVIDYALGNNGSFPSHRKLRNYGHNLIDLLEVVDKIAEKHGKISPANRLPRSSIHQGIIETLSDFASNITRYYNLDFVTGDPNAKKQIDPIQSWFEKVTQPVLNIHYKPRYKEKHKENALLIDQLLRSNAIIRYHSETGMVLNSAYDASMQTASTNFAKPYTRMYVMQIFRFMALLLSDLGNSAQRKQIDTIPYMGEFFAIFNNDDSYFKKRKTWSIYHP